MKRLQGSLGTFCLSGKTFTKRKGAQGSLEYLIIIAGIVIIAAGIFFLTRGFFLSEKESASGTMDTQSCIKMIDNSVQMMGTISVVDNYQDCLGSAEIKYTNSSAPFTDWQVRLGSEIYFLMCPEGESGNVLITKGTNTIFEDYITCEYGRIVGLSDSQKNQWLNITSQVNITVAYVG